MAPISAARAADPARPNMCPRGRRPALTSAAIFARSRSACPLAVPSRAPMLPRKAFCPAHSPRFELHLLLLSLSRAPLSRLPSSFDPGPLPGRCRIPGAVSISPSRRSTVPFIPLAAAARLAIALARRVRRKSISRYLGTLTQTCGRHMGGSVRRLRRLRDCIGRSSLRPCEISRSLLSQ